MGRDVKILGLLAIVIIVAAVGGSYLYRSSVQSERKPTTGANSALVREDSPSLGPADARVTIVEFLDPECESCAGFAPVVKKIVSENEANIRLVIRYMPLHPNSVPAATFAEAAGEQGKYWQAQELLFRKQGEWGERHGAPASAPKPDIPVLFEKYAQELGLDWAKIDAAIKERKFMAKLDRDRRDGQSLGVRQTPTFFVNGRQLARFSEADLRALVNEELKK